MQIDLHRVRPADLAVIVAAALLAVALFLPWYGVAAGREDGWRALGGAAVPTVLAVLAAALLIALTISQRSPALPLAAAVWTVVLSLISSAVIAAWAIAPPGGATERCYGLWLALAGTVGLIAAAVASLRDERPFWGVPVSR